MDRQIDRLYTVGDDNGKATLASTRIRWANAKHRYLDHNHFIYLVLSKVGALPYIPQAIILAALLVPRELLGACAVVSFPSGSKPIRLFKAGDAGRAIGSLPVAFVTDTNGPSIGQLVLYSKYVSLALCGTGSRLDIIATSNGMDKDSAVRAPHLHLPPSADN
jgi:hypothetical protein